MIEIKEIKIINQAISLTIDQIISDQNVTTIKTHHAITHRTEFPFITTYKETTFNHHIGIAHVIRIHNKIKGVVHLNITGK